jgi:hypothetical protein
MRTQIAVSPPPYLDITLVNITPEGTCGCGRPFNSGDRVGWAKTTKQLVCIPCVKQALWAAVERV